MHYLDAPELDKSDGQSLHRFIDGTSYNAEYDERVVVAELEKVKRLVNGNGDNIPNFMIRYKRWKLILPKHDDSDVLDMLYNLGNDPYEQRNLIGEKGMSASAAIIGKVEHLKILLLEWMRRLDDASPKRYYTDARFNVAGDRSLYSGVKFRHTWKRLDYWDSGSKLFFGPPVFNGSVFIRNEFLYIGRTTEGILNVESIAIGGEDAGLFRIDKEQGIMKKSGHMRVKVSFESTSSSMEGLSAHLLIKNSVNGVRRIDLVGEKLES